MEDLERRLIFDQGLKGAERPYSPEELIIVKKQAKFSAAISTDFDGNVSGYQWRMLRLIKTIEELQANVKR